MFAVTGATGKLGRLVVKELLKKVPADKVVALVRNPGKAKDLNLGVAVRAFDYEKPDTLVPALQGVDKLLLISANEVGKRAKQHQAVVDAAKKAGVKLIAYTSILRADTNPMKLAAEHKATEDMIRASGIPFAMLRHGWYVENYTENFGPALQHGAILGSAGEGKIHAATRDDFAAADAAVLVGSGNENKIFELAGDRGFTMTELAAEVSRNAGRTIVYKNLPEAEYAKILVGAGLPPPFAEILANSDAEAARGALADTSGTLGKLIGRPTTAMQTAVGAALKR